MKNQNRVRVLWAIVVILVASLACNAGASATPGATNFYMATDEAGTNRTNVFSPNDDIYVFFDVNDVEPGTNFESRWYALNIEGEDPNTPFQTIDYDYEEGIGNIYFQLTNDQGWPVGNYKVEVYMNGTEVGEQEFSVQ
jgi:hypothetical protein